MASAAYDGGAGGKLRKRAFRKSQTTPYDRPPTAIRPTLSNNNNNGWLSKIVDPASKLITAGAHKLFASIFRKRLLPPPSPAPAPQPGLGVNDGKDTEYMHQEAPTNVVTSDIDVPVDMPSGGIGVAELEDILKQKTFTRSQIEHLTTLLLSRTIENPDGVQKGRSELKLPDLQAVHVGRDKLCNLPAPGNRIELAQSAPVSIPDIRPKMLPDDVALPAEIAKAYMGSRPTKVLPSTSRLQNLLPKEYFTPSSPLSKSFSPISLAQKPVTDMGSSSNGLMTPRFRGRSAIYNMACTPYSRVYPVTNFKAAETNFNTGGGSACRNGTVNNSSQKQVLKRRSSVLENDIGSVGPIRRIRQKPNLLHPKTLSLPPPGGRQVTHVSGVPSDVAEVKSSMGQSSQSRSISNVVEENSLLGAGNGLVPPQSIEMAQKIFEQLDKFSPKRNLRKNVDVSVGKLPTKTPGMETLDSSKPLHISQDGAEGERAGSYVSSKGKIAEYMVPEPAVDRPKKRAFQMSANEDFLELDDDLPSNEVALSTPSTEGRQHVEFVKESVPTHDTLQRDQTSVVAKPSATTTTALPEKSQLESLANYSSGSETAASVPFTAVSLSSFATNMTVLDAISTQSIPKSDEVSPKIEISNIVTASSSKSGNLPPFVCTSPPAAKDPQQETLVSANRVTAEVNVSDKTDSKSTPGLGNAVIKSEGPPSVGALSSGLQATNATPVNGVLGAVPAKSDASPVLFTSSSNNQSSEPVSVSSPSPSINKFSNFSAQPTFTPSTFTPRTSSTSHVSGSVTAPFTFPSAFPSSTTLVPYTSDTTDNAKSNPNALGNAASSLLDAKPSAKFSASSPSPSINKFSNFSAQPTFTPSTFTPGTSSTSHVSGSVTAPFTFPSAFPSSSMTLAPYTSDTTDKSDAKSNPNALANASSSLLDAKPSATDSDVQTTSSNKLILSFEAGNTPVSTFAPSLSDQSASSVSTPTSTSAPVFPVQSVSAVSTPFSASAPSFAGQSAALPSALVFGVSGSTGSVFGSFTAKPFISGSGTTSSRLESGSSFPSSSPSTSSSTISTMFGGFTSLSPKPTPSFAFGSSGTAASSLAFGATANSSLASNSPPFVFGVNSVLSASTPAMTNSPFQSQPAFGNASSEPFAFGSTPSVNNNDQSTMEDTMAEDSSQLPSTLAPSLFGASMTFGAQPSFDAAPSAPSGGFGFNPAPAAGSPFQFNTQPTQIIPHNSSFQASGSLEFSNGTNSFSLGTKDKSQRKIFRVKKAGRRK